MSRWSLLKAAMVGKVDGKSSLNDVSIHRFTGFEVIKKQKCIWKGFQLHVGLAIHQNLDENVKDLNNLFGKEKIDMNHYNIIHGCIHNNQRQSTFLSTVAQLQDFIGCSHEFLRTIDCAECLIIANLKGESSDITRLIDTIKKGELRNIYHIKSIKGGLEESMPHYNQSNSMSTCSEDQQYMHLLNIEFYIQSPTVYESSSRSCQYFTYELILEDSPESRHADEESHKFHLSQNAKPIEEETEINQPKFSLRVPQNRPYRTIHILTKEPSLSNRMSCAGLLSHKLHGVDNTGFNQHEVSYQK